MGDAGRTDVGFAAGPYLHRGDHRPLCTHSGALTVALAAKHEASEA